jgi:hypothetical protein
VAASGPTPFVLLSTQRSGTSWVMDRLAKHPQVGGYGELLLAGVKGRPNWPPDSDDRPFLAGYVNDRRGRAGEKGWGHYYLFPYLEHLYEPRRDLQAIGFKLMYSQLLRYPEVLVYLRARKVRVLHLVRANLLDIYLSRESLSKRRGPHARSESNREDVKLELDPAALVQALRRLERERTLVRATLRALRLPTCELIYEDLRANEQALYSTLAFLGVGDGNVELSSSLVKLARSSHRESITNYEMIARCLSGTRYERFLVDAA